MAVMAVPAATAALAEGGKHAMKTLLGFATNSGKKGLGWAEDGAKIGVQDVTKELVKMALLAEEYTPQLSSQAISDLNEMKKEFGIGVATSVSIANSTGADMRIIAVQDYHGHVWKYPPPPNIGPGQVGVFLHTKTKGGMYGSKAAIVYRVANPDSVKMDVLLAFDAGWDRRKDRHIYVEIAGAGHFKEDLP